MNGITLSLDDVVQHVVSIGLDVFPQIELRHEQTRLTMFFEDVRERWKDLYEQLTVGDSKFKISKPFRKRPGGFGAHMAACCGRNAWERQYGTNLLARLQMRVGGRR